MITANGDAAEGKFDLLPKKYLNLGSKFCFGEINMHVYDYSFLKDKIPGNIVGLTDIVSDLKAREEFRKLQYNETFEILRQKAIIESVKYEYYEALRRSSESWHENKNDHVPFIINFMQILYRCYKELDESFTDLSLKKQRNQSGLKGYCLMPSYLFPNRIL